MKTFEQSVKSQKTVKCMIETRGEKPKEKVKNKKNKGSKKEGELKGSVCVCVGGVQIFQGCEMWVMCGPTCASLIIPQHLSVVQGLLVTASTGGKSPA